MLNRRGFIGAAAATTLVGTKAFAKATKAHKADAKLMKVYEETMDCLKTGQICLAHCDRSLKSGSDMMSECHDTVQNMLSVVEATAEVSAAGTAGSAATRALVSACLKFCEDCYAACKKHSGHHKECKDCMGSCERCIKACKAYLG